MFPPRGWRKHRGCVSSREGVGDPAEKERLFSPRKVSESRAKLRIPVEKAVVAHFRRRQEEEF